MELKIKCVDTTTDSDGSQYGKFVIEPLERGFGQTIGNSLRRVLLSSLEGSAVTSVRIEGITHEYTSIPGVQEDVIDVMLNLKGLVVKTDSKESNVVVYTGKGTSLYEAFKDIGLISPKEIYIGSFSILIISEDIAKEGIDDVVDLFLRYPSSRKSFYVIISKFRNQREFFTKKRFWVFYFQILIRSC